MTSALSLRRATDFLVVHCSASPPDPKTDVKTIDRWHRQRGFHSVGYHYVIKTDGTVQVGRGEHEVGAHAIGCNDRSIGICLIGGVTPEGRIETNFSDAQYASLKTTLVYLRERYPVAQILGHRDLPNVAKECPTFDVKAWAIRKGIK